MDSFVGIIWQLRAMVYISDNMSGCYLANRSHGRALGDRSLISR